MLPPRWKIAVQEHVGDVGQALGDRKGDTMVCRRPLAHRSEGMSAKAVVFSVVERNEPAGLEDQIDDDVERDQAERDILQLDAL